jgi:hypothetical protein
MSDDRVSGWALIAGSAGMIITMSLHPSGHISPAHMESTTRMLVAVHSLAMISVPATFLGAIGLARRFRGAHHLAVTGLVTYAFSCVAVLNAAVADGLITPRVLREIVETSGAQPAAEIWRAISHYNFHANQSYAQVFVAGSSLALMLWSLAAWPGRELSRSLSTYGCILALASMVLLFSGHLPLDAHHFGAVVLGQAIWFIGAGTVLLRRTEDYHMATE